MHKRGSTPPGHVEFLSLSLRCPAPRATFPPILRIMPLLLPGTRRRSLIPRNVPVRSFHRLYARCFLSHTGPQSDALLSPPGSPPNQRHSFPVTPLLDPDTFDTAPFSVSFLLIISLPPGITASLAGVVLSVH